MRRMLSARESAPRLIYNAEAGLLTCGVKDLSQSLALFGTLMSCTMSPSPSPPSPDLSSGNDPNTYALAESISRWDDAVQTYLPYQIDSPFVAKTYLV